MKIVYDYLLFLLLHSTFAYVCHYSCLTCSGITKNDCLTCSEGLVTPAGKCKCSLPVFQDGLCLNVCNDGYEQQGDYCQKCQGNCKTCLNTVCLSCFDNHKMINSSFCSPYCQQGYYYLATNCISLINEDDKQAEIIFYAFNEDKNSCEVVSTQFTFDPIFFSSGDNCVYFNNYLIFGNNNIWHSREGSLFLDNLKGHFSILIYMKTIFADKWNINDRFSVTVDDIIVYDYNVTINTWENYLEQNIKLNVSHTSNNLNFTINVYNQGGTGYIGISDLQIIIEKCGCDVCDINGCVQENNQQIKCLSDQILIGQTCINCNLIRLRLPNCDCLEGYYFNSQGDSCLICLSKCLTCQYQESHCTACKSSNQIPPFCDCSFNFINGMAIFSQNIPQIKITFDLNFTLNSEQCENIFKEQTLLLLGQNPLCLLKDNMIQIIFGDNFSFTIVNSIELNPQNILLEICQTQIQSIQLEYKFNGNKIPKLFLNTQKLIITRISNETISYQTAEQLNNLQWQIKDFKKDESYIHDLVNNWNQQISQISSFQLFGTHFTEENQIILQLNFCNFLEICNSVNLEIQIKFKFESFLHIYLDYQKYRIYEDLSLLFLVQVQVQVGDSLINSNDTLHISYQFYGNTLKIKDSIGIDPQSSYVISIDSSTLVQSELYFLDLVVKSGEIFQSRQLQVYINQIPILVQIKGGNKIQSYQKEFQLTIQKNNEDLDDQDNPFQQIVWTCIDFQTNKECLDQQNNYLLLEKNLTILPIQNNIFQPYTVVQFKLNALLNGKMYTDTIIVQLVEEDLPTLDITTNNNNTINNCYDNIQFDVIYSDLEFNSDMLDYKGMIISDFQILSYFEFNYTAFKIRLNTYYNLEENNDILYRFAIYNPNFLLPSLYSIPFKFNASPQKCQIQITDIKQFYLISISNCIDSDIPLQYRFSVYLINPQNQFYEITTNNRFYLSDYTYNRTLITNLFGNQVVIGVEVKDIYNGISNFIYHYSLNQSNYQFSLPDIEDNYIMYQMSYYLQYLVNQTMFLTYLQGESLSQILNSIDSYKIHNVEVYQMNALMIQLLQQKDSQTMINQHFSYWNISIQQLKKDVNQLLTQHDKYQYFLQLDVEYKIFQLFQCFSFWLQIKENLIANHSRRLLLNDDESEQLLENIMEVSKQQLNMQLPNGQQEFKSTYYYDIKTIKFTSNYAKNSQMNMGVSPNTFISEQIIKFKDNILKSEMQFENVENNSYPLYNVQIQSSNSSNQITDLNGTILYEFDVTDNYLNYQCAIKTDAGWNLDECRATAKSYKVICECSKVGPTTIVQVFINFKENIVNLFTQNNFDRIREQNYFQSLFIYIEIIFALFFIWYLYYGNQLDQNAKQIISKTYFPQKVYPTHHNTGPNDILSNYSKQSSLKTFNNLPHKIIPIIEGNETLNKDEQTPISSAKGTEKMEDFTSSDHGVQSPKSPNNQLFIFPSDKQLKTVKQIVQFPQTITDYVQEPDKLTKFLMFYKNYHKIFALYYRYDKNSSRPVRATLLYLSILGQMSVVNWFGEVFDVLIILMLSLITYTFGLLFKRILAFFLMSKYFIVQYIGNLIATLSAIFFIFVTISSIPLYRSPLACNLWALGFLTGVVVDFFVYTTIQIFIMFIVLLFFTKKSLLRKIVKALLDPVCYSIIFSEG